MPVTKRLIAALFALGAMLVASVATAGSSTADPYSHHMSCSVNVSNPRAGGTITIRCIGAHHDVDLTIILHSRAVFLGTMTTDASGKASRSVTLPAGLTGHHTLIIHDPLGRTSAIPLTISSSGTAGQATNTGTNGTGGTTAFTGVAVIGIGALGLVLLVGGGMVLLLGRRRKGTAKDLA
jgi:hypothetical protein